MTTLAHMSDDILAQILEVTHLALVNLWMAGDANLNLRIARCCRVVTTEEDLTYRTLQQWPRMLGELKSLHTLKIHVNHITEDPVVLEREIQRLPPTLTELSLSFQTAPIIPTASLEATRPAGEIEHAPTSIADLLAGNQKSKISTSSWLSTSFPALRKAEFVSIFHYNFRGLIPLFPPTLETLSYSWVLFKNGDAVQFFSTLPRGLTSLTMAHFKFSPSATQALPPGLTNLVGPTETSGQRLF